MKAFGGYKAEAPAERKILKAGGYVGKILEARVVSGDWGESLQISFDIAEGEEKDFFRKDFAANPSEDKKWRGVYRLRIPKEDGSERDGWSKKSFGRAMWAVEASNPGYRWDWDEAGLKGKLVGLLFRNREWEWNGYTGWSTECCSLYDAAKVREGDFRQPKDKGLTEGATAPFEYRAASPIANDRQTSEHFEDLPF